MSGILDISNPAALEPFRQQTDPIADQVISKILDQGEEEGINELFNHLRNNEDLAQVEFPPYIQQYFETTRILPDWADPEKIAEGERVFAAHGPSICLLLLCKSLPEAYSAAKGAMVIYKTGRMTEHQGSLKIFTRRLMETSQFVVNVCAPGGLAKGGNGIVTAQKIRLIHASIRYYLRKKGWDAEKYGEPINQEDMAGTLQSFSALIIQGLGQLGVTLTRSEVEGYFHCWRVVGHIIGLDETLNVQTYDEGLKLGYTILDSQRKKSEQGAALTKAVLDFMEQILPGNLFDDAPAAIMRYLLGNETADILEIEQSDSLIARLTPRLLKVIFHDATELQNHSKAIKKIVSHINLKLLQGLLHHFNGDKAVHFYIPPSLQKDWKLDIEWESVLALTPSIGGYRLGIEKKTSNIK